MDAVYNSPMGPLKLVATKDGIINIKYLFGKHGAKLDSPSSLSRGPNSKDKVEGCLRLLTNQREDTEAASHLKVCEKWLDAYFSGISIMTDSSPPRPALALPMKGSFFHSVWKTLISTNIGDTLSYKELAKLSGSPKAARAVGQAVKKHSLPILVPCHRVVPSGSGKRWVQGKVGNYSGGDGSSTKEWLLDHEKKMLQQACSPNEKLT